MTIERPRIVVITPVKNEEWILDRFLSVTSQFADHIIIADQNSTDRSVEICKQYQKVTLIINPEAQYDEASRQVLLLNAARDLVTGDKIILALDSDEILAANAMQTLGWQSMLKAKPGTVLFFEKPDLYLTPNQCIRYAVPWPIGYVDDGAEHKPKKVHSIRIPMPENAAHLYIHDVKVLHYALTRSAAQAAKMRFYSVLENVLRTKNMFLRRTAYSSKIDWRMNGPVELSPKAWFLEWESLGIDMLTIREQTYHWYDYEVLKYFEKYGPMRFWTEDIWNFDWESFRLYAKEQKINGVPEFRLSKPPKVAIVLLHFLDKMYALLKKVIKG